MVIHRPLLSVVLPAHREGSHLAASLDRIRAVLDDVTSDYEIVVVDDGSPDNTWEVVTQYSMSRANVRGIRFSRNFGKEAAISAGLGAAGGEGIVIMDADLQHPPELIPEMVRIWKEQGVDIVSAVKVENRKERWVVRARRRVFSVVARSLCGFDLHNASDYKLVSRRVQEAWLALGERNLFFRGIVAWFGFRESQVPFMVEERVAGESSWSLSQLIGLAVTGVTAFSTAPLRLVGGLGIAFFLAAIVFSIYTLALWFTGRAAEGFSTAIILQLASTSAILLSLGVVGEYIGRIYEEVKGRPRYIVSDITQPGESLADVRDSAIGASALLRGSAPTHRRAA